MDVPALKSHLKTGTPARLLPVVADGKKEERATSILLATFMLVPELSRTVLTEAGAPVGKSSRVQCLTEVSFKNASGVAGGRRGWRG